jgi:hypothetical protein
MPRDPAVEWLLASKDPSIRYLTLVDVLGDSPETQAARVAGGQIPGGERVQALLGGQKRDGGFGVSAYSKWTGGHWRLVSLVELAVPADHAEARQAADHVLGWLTSAEHRRTIRNVGGRVRQHASMEGNALAVCCRLGMAQDPRVRGLADSLLESQWPDGGWNCDLRPGATRSSFYESITPLWGLVEHARATGESASRAGAERAAELFLDHRLFRSRSRNEVISSKWLELHYPLYWHYDILHGLLILARAGKAADARASEALDIIESKRGKDGCWAAEDYYWRPLGNSRSNNEVVDWGRGGPNEMITLNALRVLRAAGRR